MKVDKDGQLTDTACSPVVLVLTFRAGTNMPKKGNVIYVVPSGGALKDVTLCVKLGEDPVDGKCWAHIVSGYDVSAAPP